MLTRSRFNTLAIAALAAGIFLFAACAHAAWAPGGVSISAGADADNSPSIVADGSGGVFFAFSDTRAGSSPDIFVQRVGAGGAASWGPAGVRACAANGEQECPRITADGAGGAIVTWYDERYGYGSYVVFAQRLDANGVPMWTADGIRVAYVPGAQWYPNLIPDGTGGAILAWYDTRNGNADVYAQRIGPDGQRMWGVGGVALCTAPGTQLYPKLVSDGAGGAIVTWYDHRGADEDVYAQRVLADGTTAWAPDGVALCAALGHQQIPVPLEDSEGGAFVVWQDYRGGVYADAYAQRIGADGVVRWGADGVPVSVANKNQKYPKPASDGAGGILVTWYDLRNGNGNYDVYAQRLDGNGQPQWALNGVALSNAPRCQDDPMIVSDGEGGAYVAWYDERTAADEWNVYAQHIDAAGVRQWEADGRAICTLPGDQIQVRLAPDGQGGAILGWFDGRDGVSMGVYAQRVGPEPNVGVGDRAIASRASLSAARPNPARGTVTFTLDLPAAAPIALDIVDVHGRRVRTGHPAVEFPAGRHLLSWDGHDGDGAPVRAGVYYAVVRGSLGLRSRPIAVIR